MDKGTELQMPDVSLKPVQPVENLQENKFVIPLDGKWITAENPIGIGKNFSILKNMRYRNGHPESVLGCSLLNTSAMHATYFKPRVGFHFYKSQPVESKILVQAYNTGETASVVLENQTAILTVGDFEATALWTDSTGAGIGQFSYAPDGQMSYCNGVDTCIWGGEEIECEAFIVSSAAVTSTVTNPRNYTDVMKNRQTDSANSAIIGGGNDAYTKLLVQGDEASGTAGVSILDTSGTPKVITANGNAATSNLAAKFGPCAVKFDGDGDYLTTPDHADFYMASADFTIDFWVKFASTAADQGLFSQYVDGNNFVACYLEAGSPKKLHFVIRHGGTTEVDAYCSGTFLSFVVGWWTHVAIVVSSGVVKIFINGYAQTVTDSALSHEWPNLAAVFTIGRYTDSAAATHDFNGYLDVFRVSQGIARWTAAFTPRTSPYGGTASRVFLVGSLRPLQAVKLYVAEANYETSSLTGSVLTSSGWSTLALTDGTSPGVVALAQTGTVSFASTVDTAIPAYLEGHYLYWYQFTLTAGEASIYCTTLDAPFQNLIDMWDGLYRQIASAYLYTTARVDYTTQLRTDDFAVADVGVYNSYISISALAALSSPNNCLEAGFTEKQTALFMGLAGVYANDQDTNVRIDYWDGEAYVSVGTVVDGTKIGAHSLAQSGVLSWTNNSLANEMPQVIANKIPLYYYRISWDAQLGATVCLDLIAGIPAAKIIKGYSFGVNAAGRLMLGCDNYGEKNKMIISSSNAPQVFNGDDTFEIAFGGDKALTCGRAIFAQYASNMFNLVLVFKDDETWTLTWNVVEDETQWERFQIAPNIGCPAPRTLTTVAVELDKNLAQTKTVAIWRGNEGIYMSNGQTPLCVSDDIENVFDQTKTPHVNLSMTTKEVGFFDGNKREYHWLWASGTSTTLDKEYVLDLRRMKWFEIDRATGVYLQLGIDVISTNKSQSAYGFDNAGYMLRLENGTTFNGNAIVNTMELGYQVPIQADLLAETEIIRASLVTMAKNTDSNVTLTHTMDGALTGVDYTLSMADATHTFTNTMQDLGSLAGIFHKFKFVYTSSTETKGFEPLFFSMYYDKLRDHKH